MAHADQVTHSLETLSAVERKEYDELKHYHSDQQRKKRETIVFYGYCVVGIIATLSVMGLLNL